MAWINGFQVWLSESQSLENAQQIVNFLYTVDKDWSKESIAALIGNMRHESSVNPNMYEYGYTEADNRGFGLVQWTPRSKFWNWGVTQGYTEEQLRNGDSQLARIDYEVQNNIQYIANGHQRRYGNGTKYDFSFADFRSNAPQLSVNQLTEAFMWNYEGPNYNAGLNSLAERRAFANKAYAELNWNETDPQPEPNPPDPSDPIPEPDPDEPIDNAGGINLSLFMNELNELIKKMLTADIYQAGNSQQYKNHYLILLKQLENMYKIKPNVNFFNVIDTKYQEFNTEPENDGINLSLFMNDLNELIKKMLTADIYQAGNGQQYKNHYLNLLKQLDNMYKIKPNVHFFNAIDTKYQEYNGSYTPDPDPDPDPDPNPITKMFPVRIENGINFYKRSSWAVGTLQRNMTYGVRSNGDNHFGYDIGGGGINHIIYSITNGTILQANFANGIGNRITIENDNDLYFIQYGHLESFIGKVGDKVAAGDPIAIMGQSGGNYAIHLDVKISTSINGFYSWDTTINPEYYMGIDRDNHTTLPQP